jgi:hypothetical protein
MNLSAFLKGRAAQLLALLALAGACTLTQAADLEDRFQALKPSEIKEVIVGDPKLPEMLAGKVVVVGGWNTGTRWLSSSLEDKQRQRELTQDCRAFAREFGSLMERFKDEPDVLFILFATSPKDLDRNAAAAFAQQTKCPDPIADASIPIFSRRSGMRWVGSESFGAEETASGAAWSARREGFWFFAHCYRLPVIAPGQLGEQTASALSNTRLALFGSVPSSRSGTGGLLHLLCLCDIGEVEFDVAGMLCEVGPQPAFLMGESHRPSQVRREDIEVRERSVVGPLI